MKHNDDFDCPRCPACKRDEVTGQLTCVVKQCPFEVCKNVTRADVDGTVGVVDPNDDDGS